MNLWSIVPVKPFSEGKNRLAGSLSPHTRRALNRNLLTRTLDTIRLGQIKAGVEVVSRDKDALDLVARLGSHALTEVLPNPLSLDTGRRAYPVAPELQLNAALAQAARYPVARGATKILVLPTDLTNLTAEDVRAMASPSNRVPQIIIAPSRDGGTDALMLQPPQSTPFAFGGDSFQRHRRLAMRQTKQP